MGRLLVICGPTATGKTDLGIRLAKKFNGEIISADSRQVYVGMNLGTGKDVQGGKWYFSGLEWGMGITEGTEKKQKAQKIGYWEVNGVPIWLLDVVKPNREFSVAQYVDLAWKVIHNIWKKKKSPIIVGGTGFYIKGVIDGIETLGIPPDWEIRWRLKDLPAQKLFEMLAQLDSEKAAQMNASDRKNPRRLIRAIELASKTPKPTLIPRPYTLDHLFIGLTAPYKTLYQRIDQRVEDRVRMGQETEIKRLLKKGYSWENSALGVTIGYREWQSFFEGKETKKAVIQRWKFAEHAYARRQMTWFRKDPRVCWFDITSRRWIPKVEMSVRRWYNPNVSE